MSVNRYATQAGKAYERELMVYLREQDYDVERLRLAGKEDEGDLLLRERRQYVLEAKRTKTLDLSGWIKEAELEATNYQKHRGGIARPGFVVVHKARGKGVGKSYVTTTLDEWLRQIS